MLPMVLGAAAAQCDTRMAACHNHLASVYHHYEETEQALEHYRAAQTVYQAARMEYSLEMANVCNNLATLYDDLVGIPTILYALYVLYVLCTDGRYYIYVILFFYV